MPESPAIRQLRDYIAIPSVNPMGRDDIDQKIVGERRYAEHLHEELRRLGLDAAIVGSGDRKSVIATARAQGDRETLLVASHLDTVPVDGMTIDPFDPKLEHGRVLGRGSCDTKAGMAALVAALAKVLAQGTLRRNLIVVGEADEEHGSLGVWDVLRHLETTPDFAIATEPTELALVTHHKGTAFVKLEARGRAGHSSAPKPDENAINLLGRAIAVLEQLGVTLSQRKHPMLGPSTLSLGLIGGGQAPNMIADYAWLTLDRRWLPDETTENIQREIEEALRRAQLPSVRVAECVIGKEALATAEQSTIVHTCQQALAAVGHSVQPKAVAFGTDAGPLSASGIPSVVLGPGSIEQAHTEAEYVEIAQVEAMVTIFERLLQES